MSLQSELHDALDAGGVDRLLVAEQEMHDQGVGAQVEGVAGVDQGQILDMFRRQDERLVAEGVGPIGANEQPGILLGAGHQLARLAGAGHHAVDPGQEGRDRLLVALQTGQGAQGKAIAGVDDQRTAVARVNQFL